MSIYFQRFTRSIYLTGPDYTLINPHQQMHWITQWFMCKNNKMMVYTSPNLTMVGQIKNILELHDIGCIIQRQYSSAALGDIPAIECWPELWIIDKNESERAKIIVKEALNPSSNDLSEWECLNCNELIEGQFTACWKCGTERI